jgi:hypothetical protein
VGAKQSVSSSGTTAGFNVSSGSLPSIPATGDVAVDPNGNLNWYDGAAWRVGTVADAALTAGVPVIGNGANHVTTTTATGSGSVVLSNTPTITNPIISGFVNANHNHSTVAQGGSLSVSAFNNGANASTTTFLRGDGTWASPGPTTNQNIREIPILFSGNGTPLSGTVTDCHWVDYTGSIYKVTVNSDVTGNSTITVKTTPLASYTGYAGFGNYISLGSESLTGADSLQDTTLSGWTPSLPGVPGYVCAQLTAPSSVSAVHMVIDVYAN